MTVSESVWLVKLKGLPGVASVALRAFVMLIVKLPLATVVLLTIGTWIPQRGSGPAVMLSEMPSGKVKFAESWSFCSVFVDVACNPLGHVLVCCSVKAEVLVWTQGKASVI